MTNTHLITIAVDDDSDVDPKHLSKALCEHIPGAHPISSQTLKADLFDFERNQEDQPALPMSREQAKALMDEQGEVTVVTSVGQREFFDAYSQFVHNSDDDHNDLLHDKVFDFGLPYASDVEILAVSGDEFIVSYRTDIAEALRVDDTH